MATPPYNLAWFGLNDSYKCLYKPFLLSSTFSFEDPRPKIMHGGFENCNLET